LVPRPRRDADPPSRRPRRRAHALRRHERALGAACARA
jgi:hypothetical protein